MYKWLPGFQVDFSRLSPCASMKNCNPLIYFGSGNRGEPSNKLDFQILSLSNVVFYRRDGPKVKGPPRSQMVQLN